MGIAGLDKISQLITIHSVFYFYGDAASPELSAQIASDIALYWNEPAARIRMRGRWYNVQFRMEGYHVPGLKPEEVWYNTNPLYNYFRIEAYSGIHISFADGIKSNTGYFKLDNLRDNSTTAAHEYGHSLGLDHPANLDIRGTGQPGIMYPRGTICDPEFQYDPAALPLQPGGTLNPYKRKVLQQDIDKLNLQKLSYDQKGIAVLGEFSSLYHEKHVEGLAAE